MCGLGALAVLVCSFINLRSDWGTVWEHFSRFDVMLALLCLGVVWTAGRSLWRGPGAWSDRLMLLLAGGVFGWWSAFVLDGTDGGWDGPAYIASGCSIVAFLAALYVAVKAPAAQVASEGLPPAGFYADPGGSERLRYWSGGAWTETLR